MVTRRKFSFSRLARSFTYAGKGVAWVWNSEPNFKIHCLAAALVVILGVVLDIETCEWLIMILSIGMVTGAEALNSAIEVLADATHPEKHPLIEKTKDAAAAGVLLVTIAAVIAGAIIFLPKLWQLIKTLMDLNG